MVDLQVGESYLLNLGILQQVVRAGRALQAGTEH
jgi:hypothetical protein